MGVSDVGHAHPGLDGFVLPADVARGSARAVAEEECSGDRQAKAQNQYQRPVTRLCHEFNIERFGRTVMGVL